MGAIPYKDPTDGGPNGAMSSYKERCHRSSSDHEEGLGIRSGETVGRNRRNSGSSPQREASSVEKCNRPARNGGGEQVGGRNAAAAGSIIGGSVGAAREDGDDLDAHERESVRVRFCRPGRHEEERGIMGRGGEGVAVTDRGDEGGGVCEGESEMVEEGRP
mgnify:CR=1 FL=1